MHTLYKCNPHESVQVGYYVLLKSDLKSLLNLLKKIERFVLRELCCYLMFVPKVNRNYDLLIHNLATLQLKGKKKKFKIKNFSWVIIIYECTLTVCYKITIGTVY